MRLRNIYTYIYIFNNESNPPLSNLFPGSPKSQTSYLWILMHYTSHYSHYTYIESNYFKLILRFG